MADSKVARRYAKSLLGLAAERNITDKVYADMQLISSACNANRELALLMKNPIVSTDKKDAVIKAVFENKVEEITMLFLGLMTRKGRESNLMIIAQEYINSYKESIGVKVAHVTTAAPLDAETREQILALISTTKGTKIELVETVKKELIGGFVLRIGDKQVDASIIRQIRDLERSFSENPYVKEY